MTQATTTLTRAAGHHAPMNKNGLEGVIRPFAKPDKENSKRNEGSRCGREGAENSGSSKNKNYHAHCHQDFVPIVKFQLGKRIIHCLFGRK